ncbi:MAG: hypothetical protein KAW12_16805 [Candidatus Aminicenantes bacterium]|nr:hypothetical protein [Candidatus Aminicenantes bacterium]
MISRQLIKEEIDKVQDGYLDVLYRIVKVFEYPERLKDLEIDRLGERNEAEDWRLFLDKYAGCLANDPIERGNQGQFETRENLE